MNYQIKVIECDPSGLEAALNQPASEGWQLVSCWPDGLRVRAVFQREAGAVSSPPASRPATQAAPPAPAKAKLDPAASIPPDNKFLDAVIAACNAQPPKTSKQGKPLPPGIGLAKLATTWGVTPEGVREKLQQLRVKEKGDNTSKDHWHNGFFIWLHGDFVNIREAKRKSSARA
jgi:hypothetical protein